jgi:hypothetical protein
MIMDFFAWCVLQESRTGGRTGWPPHRDRCGMSSEEVKGSFRSDRTPKYNTVWIPITDATTHNSCLYVIPKGCDPTYAPGATDVNGAHEHESNTKEGTAQEGTAQEDTAHPFSKIFQTPDTFQHIQALPAAKGSVLAFSHRLIHWGSAGTLHCSLHYTPSRTIQYTSSQLTYVQYTLRSRTIHCSHALLSPTPLTHSSHPLLSSTPLIHTPLIHSSHPLLSSTPLIHSSHTPLSYTPLIHRLSIRYSSHTPPLYTLLLSYIASLYATPLIHCRLPEAGQTRWRHSTYR